MRGLHPRQHRVPAKDPAAANDSGNAVVVIDPNQHDHFVLRQRIRLVINQYEFFLSENDKAVLFRRAGPVQVQGRHPLLHRRHQSGGADADQGASALRSVGDLRRDRGRRHQDR